MKTTITFDSDSTDKIQLLIKVAHEMGINTSADNLFAMEEDKDWKLLTERTLAKDWLNPEEDVWDNFIKSKLK